MTWLLTICIVMQNGCLVIDRTFPTQERCLYVMEKMLKQDKDHGINSSGMCIET